MVSQGRPSNQNVSSSHSLHPPTQFTLSSPSHTVHTLLTLPHSSHSPHPPTQFTLSSPFHTVHTLLTLPHSSPAGRAYEAGNSTTLNSLPPEDRDNSIFVSALKEHFQKGTLSERVDHLLSNAAEGKGSLQVYEVAKFSTISCHLHTKW